MSKQKIVLGSGKLYIQEFDGITVPDDKTLEVDENLLGLIKGGASLEYTPTFYKETDDLGLVTKEILTEEEVILKSGILTWNAVTLGKLSATGRVIENTETKKRILKVGGIANQNGKIYVLRFLHLDSVDGNVRITIVGKNKAGFAISFQKDSGTVVNAEFLAQPVDNEGTLLILEEEIK